MSKNNTKKKIQKKMKKTKHKVMFTIFWTLIVFICGAYFSTHKEEVKDKIIQRSKKYSV